MQFGAFWKVAGIFLVPKSRLSNYAAQLDARHQVHIRNAQAVVQALHHII